MSELGLCGLEQQMVREGIHKKGKMEQGYSKSGTGQRKRNTTSHSLSVGNIDI